MSIILLTIYAEILATYGVRPIPFVKEGRMLCMHTLMCFPLLAKAFTATGVNIELVFPKQDDSQTVPSENVDFYREKDKVHLFLFITSIII